MNDEVAKPRVGKISSMAIGAVLIVLSIFLAFSIDEILLKINASL